MVLKNKPSEVSRLLLIGGSNTGKKEGFSSVLTEHYGAPRTRNRFLGASTSLYGLLICVQHILRDKPSHVVFEYTLNDISYHADQLYETELLSWVLRQVVARCKAANARLVFLLMCPRSQLRAYMAGKCEVTKTYKAIAQEAGIPAIDATEILSGLYGRDNVIRQCYADDMHYTIKASQEIARHIAQEKLIEKSPVIDEAVNDWSTSEMELCIIPVSDMSFSGTVEDVQFKTAAFSATGKRLCHGARAYFQFEGEVLGLLANTSSCSGYIEIASNGTTFVKNMFDGFYKEGASRVFLKQFTRPVRSVGNRPFSISATVEEGDLKFMPMETTKHERPPISNKDQWGCELIMAIGRRSAVAKAALQSAAA